MSGIIAWLTGLRLAVLYPIMAVAAAVENIFPPIPADSIVALGSWLAARGEGTVISAFPVSPTSEMKSVSRRCTAGMGSQHWS